MNILARSQQAARKFAARAAVFAQPSGSPLSICGDRAAAAGGARPLRNNSATAFLFCDPLSRVIKNSKPNCAFVNILL
jgi:hypothetical protein